MINNEVKLSFGRCEANGNFAEYFYNNFFASSPKIEPLFKNTDFNKQRILLRATVFLLVNSDVDNPKAKETLERIGHSHSRSKLNIAPELYELWLDSICKTVKDMDADWTSELEQSWRSQLRPGIDIITSYY